MLKSRLKSGAAFILAIAVAAIYAPPVLVVGLILLLVILGMLEFYDLLDHASIGHQRHLGVFFAALYIIAVYAGYVWVCLDREVAFIGVLFLILAALFFQRLVVSEDDQPLESIGGTYLGIFYIAFFSSFLVHLLYFDGSGNGKLFIVYLITVVKSSDIGAYFTGRWIGKHKFAPRISPNKTWEGVLGGVLTSVCVSLIWFTCTKGDLRVVRLSVLDFSVLGLLLPWIAIFGDLAESMLKREADVKDSGTLITGMGGILDVMDSLLFAAPALYLYARQFQG